MRGKLPFSLSRETIEGRGKSWAIAGIIISSVVQVHQARVQEQAQKEAKKEAKRDKEKAEKKAKKIAEQKSTISPLAQKDVSLTTTDQSPVNASAFTLSPVMLGIIGLGIIFLFVRH